MEIRKDIFEQLEQLPEQPEPDIGMLQIIHYGENSYIAFCRKPLFRKKGKDGNEIGMENLFCLKNTELNSFLPAMREHLFKDAYMGINSLYRAAPWENKLTGLPDVWNRSADRLQYLNACYVDLDVGRTSSERKEQRLNWRDAMALAGKIMDDGKLPQASIFARSGRGLYILWLLCDPKETNNPPKAWPEKTALYKMINQEMNYRLKHLAADPAAVDAARILRVPGSLHTGANRLTKYVVQLNDKGKLHFYTLKELAEFLNIKSTGESGSIIAIESEKKDFRKIINRGSQPGRKKSWLDLQRLRIDDLMVIQQRKQGFKKGYRRRTLTFYAELLRNLETSIEETLEALKGMAQNCIPPYPSDPTDQDIKQLAKIVYDGKPKNRLNKKLCGLLGVTPELAEQWELKTIIPPELKTERKINKLPSVQEIKKEIRLNALRQLVQIKGKGFPVRQIVEALADIGIKTNRQTVNLELRKIGYEIPKQGRPKK